MPLLLKPQHTARTDVVPAILCVADTLWLTELPLQTRSPPSGFWDRVRIINDSCDEAGGTALLLDKQDYFDTICSSEHRKQLTEAHIGNKSRRI